jgi:hypothetical protein
MPTKATITRLANESLDYAMRRSVTARTASERGDLEEVITLLISPLNQYLREHIAHMPSSTYLHLYEVISNLYDIQQDVLSLAQTASKQ